MKKQQKQNLTCNDVQDLLVDYIEGNIDLELKKQITQHLHECEECQNEFLLTKKLLNNETNISIPSEEYFKELKTNITTEIDKLEQDLHNKALEYIYNLDFNFPDDIKTHIKKCPVCQQELKQSKELYNLLMDLKVSTPKEPYFEKQKNRILWRVTYEERERVSIQQNILDFLKSVFSILEYFIRPTSIALITSVFVFFLVINKMTPGMSREEQIAKLSNILRTNSFKIQTSAVPKVDFTVEIYGKIKKLPFIKIKSS